MLVLKRKEGQWVNILHKSGDMIRFRVYQICGGEPGRASLAFDDEARNFEIQRPERIFHGAVSVHSHQLPLPAAACPQPTEVTGRG
jgi:hypothetical protein